MQYSQIGSIDHKPFVLFFINFEFTLTLKETRNLTFSGFIHCSELFLCRFFKPSDVPLIEEDLNELKHLFFQGGDGIPMEEIEAKCKDIDDLLPLLAMNTNDLIYNLKRVNFLWSICQESLPQAFGFICSENPYNSKCLIVVRLGNPQGFEILVSF